MRVLAIEPGPAFSVADVHKGWTKALRHLGCDIINFNFEDRLNFYNCVGVKNERTKRWRKALSNEDAIRLASKGIEVAAYEYWPDIVLVTSCFFVPVFVRQLLRKRGHKVVLLLTESPYEDGKQLERAADADLVLLNDPTNLEKFLDVNPNTHYVPHAYDPELHKPGPPNPKYLSDFCFVGTGFPSRRKFFEQVDWTDIDAMLCGNWQGSEESPLASLVPHPLEECVDNTQTVEIYNSTKASANLYRREFDDGQTADGWAMGPREVELAASGTCFLTEERGENREVLPMVPTFEGPVDFEQQLRWLLQNDGAREDIALKAREAIADRTFESNAGRLLSLL